MMLLPINDSRCLSTKNKNSTIQCPNKTKNGCMFCGVHARSKNPTRYDLLYNNHNSKDNIKIIDFEEKPMEEKNPKKTFYSIDELMKLNNLDQLKVKTLRNTIKHLNLNSRIKLNQSKRILYTELVNYFSAHKKYLDKVDDIIKIQSLWRKNIVSRRSVCVNTTDFLTLDSIYDIGHSYFCIYTCAKNNKLKYGFDLRSLSDLFEDNDNPKNPYTCNEFSPEFVKKVLARLDELKKSNVKTSFEPPKLSEKQKITNYMVEIFQMFDLLDNYTDHRWFEDLNLYQLKDLYKKAEDIWNYRTQLPMEVKKKIVNSGIAFTTPVHVVDKIVNKSKLQYLLLDEFKRFGTEGVTRDDKKLGAMLMLTAMVEVSPEAASAMPQYVQVY